MAENGIGRKPARVFAMGLALVVACALGTRPARADVSDVSGMDYVFGAAVEASDGTETSNDAEVTQSVQAESSSFDENMIDFCSLTYDGEDAVYVELRKDERAIASHLYYPLPAGPTGSTGPQLGVLSLEIPSFDPAAHYTIGVYADHDQTKRLFSGSVEPVYADVDGQSHLMAIRTIAEGEEHRKFSAPSIITIGDATYARTSATEKSADPLTYAYELSDGTSVDATVTYVDEEGNELKRVQVATLVAGQSEEYEIPATIIAREGATTSAWRTVSYTGKVRLSFPGQSEYTIACKPLVAPQGLGVVDEDSFYVAQIRLVDEEGSTLGSDSLNVTSTYLYTPPTMLHVNSGGEIVDYRLSESNASLSASGVLELDPASDGVVGGSKTINIAYERVDDSAPRTWTVEIVNGKRDPKAEDRIIDTKTFTVSPGETATYVPEKSIKVGDTVYVPVSSTKETYTYTHGEVPESGEESVYPKLTVYYVPDGCRESDPYEITVNYVNIATSAVIESHALTARPESRDNLEITSPETFTAGGVEYVRLDGQEQSIWHSFYSSARTYNIYYRDINDDLHANTTITRVEVAYEDGGATTTDRGTTIDDGTTVVDGGTTYVDGGVTYTDGGTTTTSGGTKRTSGGTTTTDAGTTRTDGGTTYTDGTTTYIDGGATHTTVDGGVIDGGVISGGVTPADGGTTTGVGTTSSGGSTTTGSGTTSSAGTAGAPAATRASIPTNSGALTVISDGDGNATMTDSAGRDTNTMRIDDEATPLAGPGSTGAEVADAGTRVHVGVVVAIIIALVAVIGACLFWLFMRRRKDEGEEIAPDDGSEA